MRFMNDYDIESARRWFGQGDTPNRLALAIVVDRLREWADDHSDGWAYWPKPARAAAKAMSHIDSPTWADVERMTSDDITDAEMRAAVAPIKAFLTRQKVDVFARELILRAATDPVNPNGF